MGTLYICVRACIYMVIYTHESTWTEGTQHSHKHDPVSPLQLFKMKVQYRHLYRHYVHNTMYIIFSV